MGEKQYEVIVTPFAESALLEQADYLRDRFFDDKAADNLLDQMEASIQELAFFPDRYQFVDREPWHSNNVRFYPFMGYNIYYWVNEEKMRVYIIDVISQKMNQDKRLIESLLAYYKLKPRDEGEGV